MGISDKKRSGLSMRNWGGGEANLGLNGAPPHMSMSKSLELVNVTLFGKSIFVAVIKNLATLLEYSGGP